MQTSKATPSGRTVTPKDDSLVSIKADTKVAEEIVLSDLLIKRGRTTVLLPVSKYEDDPLHINDIQPVLQCGPFWKKGDQSVSLSDPSPLLLYRPGTQEVV